MPLRLSKKVERKITVIMNTEKITVFNYYRKKNIAFIKL